jgi:hypothetical protein
MSAATSSASAADVHESSAKGFSLAANTLYDAGRPTYNDECVDYLLNEAILDEVKTVLTSGEPSDTPQPLTYRVSAKKREHV